MSVTREFSSGGVSLAHPTKVIKTTASDLCHVEGYTMTRKKCVVHQLNIFLTYLDFHSTKGALLSVDSWSIDYYRSTDTRGHAHTQHNH